MLSPDLEEKRINYSEEIIDYMKKLWAVSFTDDNLFKIQQKVDYSDGESAPWQPCSGR